MATVSELQAYMGTCAEDMVVDEEFMAWWRTHIVARVGAAAELYIYDSMEGSEFGAFETAEDEAAVPVDLVRAMETVDDPALVVQEENIWRWAPDPRWWVTSSGPLVYVIKSV